MANFHNFYRDSSWSHDQCKTSIRAKYCVPPGESAGKTPTEWGMGSSFTFSQASLILFQEKIDLLLNQLKFEKTDNVFIKGIHSGFWQNFLSLLAQMVVEQEAEKLFSWILYCRTFLGRSNHGHFLKHYLLNYNFA